MRDLQGWTIVVIGATDGVGYDSAKAFAEHNAHVVLVGRNEEKSQKCVELTAFGTFICLLLFRIQRTGRARRLAVLLHDNLSEQAHACFRALEEIKAVAGPQAKLEYMLCDVSSFK